MPRSSRAQCWSLTVACCSLEVLEQRSAAIGEAARRAASAVHAVGVAPSAGDARPEEASADRVDALVIAALFARAAARIVQAAADPVVAGGAVAVGVARAAVVRAVQRDLAAVGDAAIAVGKTGIAHGDQALASAALGLCMRESTWFVARAARIGCL